MSMEAHMSKTRKTEASISILARPLLKKG